MCAVKNLAVRIACGLGIAGGWLLLFIINAAAAIYSRTLPASVVSVSPSLPLTAFLNLQKWSFNFYLPVLAGTLALPLLAAFLGSERAKCVAFIIYLTAWLVFVAVLLLLLLIA